MVTVAGKEKPQNMDTENQFSSEMLQFPQTLLWVEWSAGCLRLPCVGCRRHFVNCSSCISARLPRDGEKSGQDALQVLPWPIVGTNDSWAATPASWRFDCTSTRDRDTDTLFALLMKSARNDSAAPTDRMRVIWTVRTRTHCSTAFPGNWVSRATTTSDLATTPTTKVERPGNQLALNQIFNAPLGR